MKGINERAADWTVKVLGLKGFTRGIRATVFSSFIGSAATISEFSFLFSLFSLVVC